MLFKCSLETLSDRERDSICFGHPTRSVMRAEMATHFGLFPWYSPTKEEPFESTKAHLERDRVFSAHAKSSFVLSTDLFKKNSEYWWRHVYYVCIYSYKKKRNQCKRGNSRFPVMGFEMATNPTSANSQSYKAHYWCFLFSFAIRLI
jgi:hypothetical protein